MLQWHFFIVVIKLLSSAASASALIQPHKCNKLAIVNADVPAFQMLFRRCFCYILTVNGNRGCHVVCCAVLWIRIRKDPKPLVGS
jgi:hypothetical protein